MWFTDPATQELASRIAYLVKSVREEWSHMVIHDERWPPESHAGAVDHYARGMSRPNRRFPVIVDSDRGYSLSLEN